jgi:multidrug resistance efflux pump
MRATTFGQVSRVLTMAIAVTSAACTPSAPAATPAGAHAPALAQASDTVSTSVRVQPERSSDLGFLISAPVRQVLVHEGEAVEAGQSIVLLDTPQLELEVTAAEQGLVSARQDEYIQGQGRRKWDGFKFVWVAGPPEQRTAAHARVLQAQARLDAARAGLEQGNLRAPFDGTVVSIGVRSGEVVQPGQVVATVGDLEHLRVETTDLSERDIASVHVGQQAEVTLEALGVPLAGSVAAIDPLAGRSADGDVIYMVTIKLKAQPKLLLWGMTGKAEIQIHS